MENIRTTDSKSALPFQFMSHIQAAQEEMVMLYNCKDAKPLAKKGYYFDVIEQFDKCWKKSARTLTKGEFEQYRDKFCAAADSMDDTLSKTRDWFKQECEKRFEGPTELLAHLIMAKFILRAANTVFKEMYGNYYDSKVVRDITIAMDRFAHKFKIRAKSADLEIKTDIDIVSEFNTVLDTIARHI